MQINVTLNITDLQLLELFSLIMNDSIIKNAIINKYLEHKKENERLETWNLSVRLTNLLREWNIHNVSELTSLTRRQFLNFRGSGRRSLIEIVAAMNDKGYEFKNEDAREEGEGTGSTSSNTQRAEQKEGS